MAKWNHSTWVALGSILVVTAQSQAAEDFTVLKYSAELSPKLEDKSISGQTRISLTSRTQPIHEARFPINNLLVSQVWVDGQKAKFRTVGPSLVIDFPKPLPKGRSATLSIEYHGTPAKGLIFGPNYVYSAFFSCHWMICLEEPGEKALLELRITAPANLKVIGSGNLVSKEELPNKRVRHRFVEDRHYSSYLFGFAMGDFIEAEEKGLRYLGVGGSKELLLRKFSPTEEMLRFFAERAGIALPHTAYTQLLVPGSEAQENSSFSVVGQDELDPILSNPQEDWVIAHELAHQWWGNLVTCKTWQHFWLNEGITVFMVAAFKEHRWGKAAYQAELDHLRKRFQRAIDAKLDVPLSYAGEYPSLQLKRAITYSKAALFLASLRVTIGEAAFWNGLRAFTRKFADRTAQSKDFQRAMEEASKNDLQTLFDKWVY